MSVSCFVKQCWKAAVANPAEHGYDTMLDVWRVICWIVFALSTGVSPEKDWNGDAWEPDSVRARLANNYLLLASILSLYK